MGSLTYFPDDERFIYYGEGPSVFEGVRRSFPFEEAFKKKMVELVSKSIHIDGFVVMKGKDLIPMPYNFPEKTIPEMPLLSKDGTRLIYQKALSGGKFFLYSPDGNHRLVHHAGSVQSVALSMDGELLGICRDDSIVVIRISDDTYYRSIFLRRSPDWDQTLRKMPHLNLRLMPEVSSRIIKSDR